MAQAGCATHHHHCQAKSGLGELGSSQHTQCLLEEGLGWLGKGTEQGDNKQDHSGDHAIVYCQSVFGALVASSPFKGTVATKVAGHSYNHIHSNQCGQKPQVSSELGAQQSVVLVAVLASAGGS